MRLPALLLVLPLAGCLAPPPVVAPAPSTAPLRPEAFFLGATRGTATLTVRGAHIPEIIRVESVGRNEPDGRFRLDQTIHRESGTSRRTWWMEPTSDHTYTATLTDAHGPVRGTVTGPTFRLRYRMNRWGTTMEQTLTLLPGGTEVQNEATVRWLGVPVAYLSERIVRLP